MGRIKTRKIKRTTATLFKEHEQEFKTDFNENKKVLGKVAGIRSKKTRNVIAGYATRLKKQRKD